MQLRNRNGIIGFSFASIQFTERRTVSQLILGLCVSVAFIIWGIEQFMPNQAVVSSLDDMVVFLFVLDLAIVINRLLKEAPRKKAPNK
jgi:hypothetical protein